MTMEETKYVQECITMILTRQSNTRINYKYYIYIYIYSLSFLFVNETQTVLNTI
jgi:hypothetical protein